MAEWGFGFSFDMELEEPLDFFDVRYKNGEKVRYEKRPHGECNTCKHYQGVKGCQGHAPCSFWNIGGVMWNDYCSRYEKGGDS